MARKKAAGSPTEPGLPPFFKGPWRIAKGQSVGAGNKTFVAGQEGELSKVLGKDEEARLKAKGVLIAAE